MNLLLMRAAKASIIAPTLERAAAAANKPSFGSAAAVTLVTGTGLAETGYEAVVQSGGPALGFFQMEPATFADMWNRYLPQQQPGLFALAVQRWGHDAAAEDMVSDVALAAFMCRVRYLPGVGALPSDAAGQAAYWKRVYNTSLGAGAADATHVAMWQAAIGA